ncbi:fructose-specific PTS transporter subunit EIIC [Rodentibacter caecimuris]|uniref:fructose-specific PTS transporter subunit EIIC n=1 Tax=Rodentibacter caecimuris TaxID=1796644 RepID=UPI002249393F|nr:fructose-specific PTS transporter subunit EIIC [Rodentibacter heylii]MCX2961736.1 fructose-specific PTS transporter subunit EIIC [Rodentibacter heylii]
MKLFLTQSDNVGSAKAYLLREVFRAAAQKADISLTENLAEADIALVVGATLPNNSALVGKKVLLVSEESAMNAPEATLTNAQTQAVDYVAPESAVSFNGVSKVKNIVAVTACPTGVAHTFMSAEAIEAYAKKQGWNVKVETRGQVGAGNEITPEEVAAADLVFVAADIDVPLDKFKGKPMYRTSTGLALKKTAQEFDKAFKEAKVFEGGSAKAANSEEKGEKKGIYKHLMTGVSHMLPFVVAGGLLIAIAFALGGIYAGDKENLGTLAFDIKYIGDTAFGLMIAAFAGYVAYSIADRPGLVVGFVSGMLAYKGELGLVDGNLTNLGGAGILGGILAGFLSGYIVKLLNITIKLPASFLSLKPILILPLLGTGIVSLLMLYIFIPPIKVIMDNLVEWLNSMGQANALILGAVVGAMMCVDMGGPINKAAYTFGTGLIASQVYTPMAAIMAAGMVPPIGMAIATWIARNKFTANQRDAGKASFVLGLCFISEGALPFVAADPIRVIISSVVGGATAGAISMASDITLQAPHGGLFVIPFVSEPVRYLAAIAAGALITGVIYAVIKPRVTME